MSEPRQSQKLPWRRIGICIVLGAAFSGIATQFTSTFQFAERAIVAAGDTPPTAVAARLEWLRRLQAMSNAAFVFSAFAACASLSMVRLAASRGFGAAKGFLRVLIATAAGAVAGAAGAELFRLRPLGDQNLTAMSVIHATTWLLLAVGSALGTRSSSPRALTTLARAGVIGAAWGFLFPAVLTVFMPGAYLGTLIPGAPWARLVWAAVGGVVMGLAIAPVRRNLPEDHAATLVPPSPGIPV